jgi:hypothetical protein
MNRSNVDDPMLRGVRQLQKLAKEQGFKRMTDQKVFMDELSGEQLGEADAFFARIAAEAGPQEPGQWHGALTVCDWCGTPFEGLSWMIDGVDPDGESEEWSCACSECAWSNRIRIGRGQGQLYQRKGADWILVAGMDARVGGGGGRYGKG